MLVGTKNGVKRLYPDGSVDLSFIPPTGFELVFWSPIVATTGEIVAASDPYSGDASSIIWLTADGIVTKRLGLGAHRRPLGICIQASGKIVLANDDTVAGVVTSTLYRLNPDGTDDPTFLPTAFVGYVYQIRAQADDQILACGTFEPKTLGGIARVLPNGGLDQAYVPGRSISGSGYDGPSSFQIDAQGRALYVGAFTTAFQEPRRYLVRILPDGSLDRSFSFVPPDLPGSIFVPWSRNVMAILPGGDILVTLGRVLRLSESGTIKSIRDEYANSAGYTTQLFLTKAGDVIVDNGASDFFRLTQGGSLTSSLGHYPPTVSQLTKDPLGQIWMSGWFQFSRDGPADRWTGGIARINADGTQQLFYKSQGWLGGSFAFQGEKLVLADEGGVLSRLDGTGSLDPGFTQFPFPSDVRAITVQSDGKILIGGQFQNDSTTNFFRLLADGRLDASFTPRVRGFVYSIEAEKDGRILVGGFFRSVGDVRRDSVAMLNADGTLDPSFDPGPIQMRYWEVPTGTSWQDVGMVYAAKSLPAGGVFVAGEFEIVQSQGRSGIAWLDPDGKLRAQNYPSDPQIVKTAVELDSEARILVAEGSTIIRLLSDGTPDPTFTKVALSTAEGAFRPVKVSQIVSDPSGAIFLAGVFDFVNGIEVPNLAKIIGGSAVAGPRFRLRDQTTRTFAVEGQPAPVNTVEQTSDLLTWTPIATNAPFTGFAEIAPAPFAQRRFLRAVSSQNTTLNGPPPGLNSAPSRGLAGNVTGAYKP